MLGLCQFLCVRRSPRYRVTWSGSILAGVIRVTGPARITDVTTHHSGGGALPQKTPGRTDFRPFTLDLGPERNPAFEAWVAKSITAPSGTPPADLRQDFLIARLDRQGQPVATIRVFRCWVAEHILFPNWSDIRDARVAERLIIAHEGWQREG